MEINYLKILLSNKTLKSRDKGFTLIELLLVVIIMGILSAIALPTLIGQVGKARETEAKTTLGTLARSQQAYHFEAKTFYNGNDLTVVGIAILGEYYSFTADNTADGVKAIHTAYAINPSDSGARDFAVGTYYNAPQYTQTLCLASGIDNDGTTSSVTAQTDGTCNGGTSIQ